MRTTPYRQAAPLRDLYAAAYLVALAERTPLPGHPVSGKPSDDVSAPLTAKS